MPAPAGAAHRHHYERGFLVDIRTSRDGDGEAEWVRRIDHLAQSYGFDVVLELRNINGFWTTNCAYLLLLLFN